MDLKETLVPLPARKTPTPRFTHPQSTRGVPFYVEITDDYVVGDALIPYPARTPINPHFFDVDASSRNERFNLFLPPQEDKAGMALYTDGTDASWQPINTDTATTITGLLKGSSGLIVAAVDGTDYLNSSSAANLFPTLNQNTTGSAAKLTTPRTINGVAFDGSANITIVAATSIFATPRNINGVPFDGSADITVTAAAGTLTGTTLNSSVITSSLTSVATITTGVWHGTTIGVIYGGTGLTSCALGDTLYGSAPNTISKLSGNTTTTKKFMTQIGDSVNSAAPIWGTITVNDVPTLNQNTTGSAATLTTPRTINGVAFDGSANITVTAAAGTLTGTTLNSTVVTSSLTSVGTIVTGIWNGTIITSAHGGTGNGFVRFSGPSVTEKTFSLPNANATILTTNTVVTVIQGGTGVATLTGMVKGNGTSAFSAATSGTDYSAGTSGLATGILKSTTSTGTLTIAVAGDFPTLNQNTTGSAATLTTPRNINGVAFDGSANISIGTLATPRAIYGNNFDGSAALTQIIASTYGGTGNGFTKFTGPTTSEKTFTLPNASATILTSNAVVTVPQGGTGVATLTGIVKGNGTSAFSAAGASDVDSILPTQTGNSGKVLSTNGTVSSWIVVSGTGTVTSASVATANGFAGSVATSTTTPAITIATTITGVIKGNGTAISAATSGVDFSAGTSALATGILKSTTSTGTLTIAVAGDFPTLNQNTTGSAATLTTARTINGVSFNGSANITVTAASSTLTGTVLSATVVTSSLTSVGTITTGVWNGTVIGSSYGGAGTVSGLLKGNGSGTVSAGSAGDVNAILPTQTGNSGKFLTTNGTVSSWDVVSGAGTVTSVSVVSANGFTGSVATSTITPAITIATSITGIIKGNGTAISAATSGTDYSAGTSGLATGILKSTTTTGTLTIAVAGDFPTLNQNTTGSAATLTTPRNINGVAFNGSADITITSATLTVARNINGVSFNGSADITVTAAAGTLTGTTLNATVVTSSLTSVGTIATGVWNGTVIGSSYGGAGTVSGLLKANGSGTVSAGAASDVDQILPTQTGNSGKVLTTDGTSSFWISTGVGSVTDVSVVSANGFAGSVATSTTTPAITLTTTITGIIKGNGTAISAATSGDFPTLNQNTTGSAATLTTPRAIYGNNFDGSAALTQIIASTYGGTGNGFFAVSGPASSTKTFTFPNASATVLTSNAAVTVAQGGTGIASGTSGGIPYFSGSTTIASSAALTANVPVIGGGAGTTPSVATGLLYASGGPHLTITAQNAAYVPLIAKGAGSQSADLQQWQNSGSTVLAKISSSGGLTVNTLDYFKVSVVVETGTTYTLQASDSGKVIEFTNGSDITVTAPNSLPVGFTVTLTQLGAGQVIVDPASGSTLRNRLGYYATAGLYAGISLYVRTNSGGSSAEYLITGDVDA